MRPPWTARPWDAPLTNIASRSLVPALSTLAGWLRTFLDMNRRLVMLPAVAVLAAAGFWLFRRPLDPIVVPAVAWRVGTDATGGFRLGVNYDDVAPETPIRMQFRCDEPRHVYVFTHSLEDGTLLLFPSPQVKSDLANPLAAGSPVLPGSRDGKDLAWNSRRQVSATTTFLVVASREPIAALEALLPHLRRWTNTALTDGSMQVMNPPTGGPTAGPRTALPEALLQRAAEASFTAEVVNGPLAADSLLRDVWIGSWRIRETPAAQPEPPKNH